MLARFESNWWHDTCYFCTFTGIDYIGLKHLPSEEKLNFDLSVVMVNYRTPNLVTDCLESLLPELQGVNSRVVIVDNNSRDNSFDIIQKWLTENDTQNQCLLVQSNENRGFSSGNNIGIKTLRARFYLLLNSDTVIRPGAIHRILDATSSMPNTGLISPRLEDMKENVLGSCFHFLSPVSEFCSAAQTGFIDRLLSRFIVPLPVQTVPTNPEWTSFACVFIRDEVFQQIGLLDERYFMYFEDVEFCYRARKAKVGYR